MEDLKEIGVEINWKKIVRDIVIRNMQDIMFYNGVNQQYDEIEYEDETEQQNQNQNPIQSQNPIPNQ